MTRPPDAQTPLTVEERLSEWMKQPGAFVRPCERLFIEDMRSAANASVGYGWMQQIIEWEWQNTLHHKWQLNSGAFGPDYFGKRIAELELAIAAERERGRRVREETIEKCAKIAEELKITTEWCEGSPRTYRMAMPVETAEAIRALSRAESAPEGGKDG